MDFAVALLDDSTHLEGCLSDKFRLLMGRYWIYARVAIISTRSYEPGLSFVDRLDHMNAVFRGSGELCEEEFEANDQKLILFRLQLLDKLDWWQEYADLFDAIRITKRYVLHYQRRLGVDSNFDSYVLESFTPELHYVHFLYGCHHRYVVVKRKLEKMKAGKAVGNLKHKTQWELTEEQIRKKFDYIMDAAHKGLDVFEPW